MTIDERLEALTQSVELMAAMHRDSERAYEERFAATQRAMEERAREAQERAREAQERSRETDELFRQTAERFREIMDSINALARIAGLHQDRLDEHGERLDNLERH